MNNKRIVVALGRNAFGETFPEQQTNVKKAACAIADLVEAKYQVVITHSNGPQVGMIQTAMTEFARLNPDDRTVAPMSVCGAMSEGYIGYDLQNAIREELLNRGIYKTVSTIITQVRVDPFDIAFSEPSKIIGRYMTKEEAEAETLNMLNIYNKFFHDYLAIPSIVGRKTEKEKFAGAEYTYTVEALMYNGVALQSGTSHFFGQKFSKAYDIKYLNRENKLDYPYQTSWGVSTRMMGALIMVHSDDYGLVLPPRIAPNKVVIIPISNDLEVMSMANDYLDKLKKEGIEAYIDDSEKSPGYKFAEAEVLGIPVRIEIGKRDLENNVITLVRRDTREKREVFTNTDIVHDVKILLEDIQRDMYDRALRRREEMTYTCTDIEDFKDIINNHPGFVKAMWCGDTACEEKIKEIRGCKSRCIPFEEEHLSDKCIVCGREAKHLVIWGIQY